MKNKLKEIAAVLSKVITCFPYIFSTKELALLGAQETAKLDPKLYGASLQLINIKAEIKSLDQLVDQLLEEITDEKEVILYFADNLRDNLDRYTVKLDSVARQTKDIALNKLRDPMEAIHTICGRIIRNSQVVIANTSDARSLSMHEDKPGA